MNKLFGLFLLALAFLAPSQASAVQCFWSGGTGNINDTSKWFLATGGTGGACTAAGGWPNSTSDNAIFDGASGGGTITRNVNWTVSILNISAFTGTFGNSGDTATVNLNTFTNNGSGARTLNLGASTWTCGQSVFCTWSVTGATNLTLNANTSTLVVTNLGAVFSPGVFTYNVVTFNGGLQGSSINFSSGSATFGTWNIGTGIYIVMLNGLNISVTNLNFTGTGSLSSWTGFASASFNNNFTITLANPASCSYCIFRDTTAATNAITATNSIDQGHNTNVSITPPSGGGGGGGGRIIGG
jgi:hypothetical protein